MQFRMIDVELAPDEPMHITPYSDVHWDSRDCDRTGWLGHYKHRASLPNARFINNGDFNNLVMPRDLKRHVPSASQEAYGARDDYINHCLDDTIEAVQSVPNATWDMWGMGNHEYSALKFHNVDIPALICNRLGIYYGTYSGRLFYRIHRRGVPKHTALFKLLYHHGAWGGQVIKGFGGAYRWAMPLGSWHVFCYGHNHSENIHKEPFWDTLDDGTPKVFNRYFINTGGWAKSLSRDGQPPDYAEIAGHPITTTGTPLIKVWYERKRPNFNMELRWAVES